MGTLTVTWIRSQQALTGLLEQSAQAEPDMDQEAFRADLPRTVDGHAVADRGAGVRWSRPFLEIALPSTASKRCRMTSAVRLRAAWYRPTAHPERAAVVLGFELDLDSVSGVNPLAAWRILRCFLQDLRFLLINGHFVLPGTPVLLADGTRAPIENVRAGQRVMVTDPYRGLTTSHPVKATITTKDDKDFSSLTVRAGGRTSTITATDTHPFWLVDQKRWVDAGDIRPGAQLRTPSGSTLPVTKVSHYTKQQRTHDLTIKSIHTYYVGIGATDALVHNNNGCKEVEIGPYKAYEQARNDALDKLGEIDPHTRKPLYGRLETANSTYEKKVGFTTRVNGIYKEFRMDYDPKKGPHINVTVGKGKSAKKYAVKWEGTEQEFEKLLKGNS